MKPSCFDPAPKNDEGTERKINMTEKFKNFLQEVSKDERLKQALNEQETPEKVIAFARAHGYDLTDDDFKAEPSKYGELDDDELEAVSGGSVCACVVGGGGKGGDDRDEKCACVVAGFGYNKYGDARCACAAGGGGAHCESSSILP